MPAWSGCGGKGEFRAGGAVRGPESHPRARDSEADSGHLGPRNEGRHRDRATQALPRNVPLGVQARQAIGDG